MFVVLHIGHADGRINGEVKELNGAARFFNDVF